MSRRSGIAFSIASGIAAVFIFLLIINNIVHAQTTQHYDGTCGSNVGLTEIRCYSGYTGYDSGAGVPIGSTKDFTAALTTVDVTMAVNALTSACLSDLNFQLKQGATVIETWVFATQIGTTEYQRSFNDLYVGGVYNFYIFASGNGCGNVEWVDVYGVEGGGDEPTPEVRCINDDPDLENSSVWTDIGSPTWLTSTVALDKGDGFYQTVDLDPGAYTIEITATFSPENLDYKPLTVSLGITETAQRVMMWGIEYVDFVVAEAGTYTLTVQSDYDEQVELGFVCLSAKLCVNQDPYLTNDLRWEKIGDPNFITSSSGFKLDFMDGIYQDLALPAGMYQLEGVITDVVTGTAPYLWLGADSAGAQIKMDGAITQSARITATWDFYASDSGIYRVNAKNPAGEIITLTYLCLRTIDKELCTFDDYSFDDSGWTPTGDVEFRDGSAVLGCGGYVEQDVYLNKDTHVISVTASADFLVSGSGFNPYNEGGLLTMYWEGEYMGSAYSIDISGGLYSQTHTYPATITIPLDGYYSFRLWNRDNCYNNSGLFWERKTGHITVQEICLPLGIDQIGPPAVGDCQFVRDSSMEGWGWADNGAVQWTGTTAELSEGGSISQTISISSTDPITQLVAYVVARAAAGSELAVSLGDVYTFTISQTLESEFAAFTATLSYSNPADYVLTAIAGAVEIEFVCLYRVGEDPGPWEPGADGDPVCIKPLAFDWASLTWDVIESVSRILKFIWEWIVFFWCEVVKWLARIWFQLKRWTGNLVVNMTDWLTQLPTILMNMPLFIFLFDLLLFAAWLPARFWSLLIRILSPILWAINFTFTLIPTLFSNIANPTQVEALDLGDFEQGFTFVKTILDNTPLIVLFTLVNAILWLVFIVWAIRQFSQSNT